LDLSAAVSGHVFLYEGRRRKTWCVKWRDHEGQHERRLGPAWTETGPPADGFYREREAKAALAQILVAARQGISEQRRTGVTFARAAEDWYEHGMLERDWSPSTKADYRSALVAHLVPAFGDQRIEAITPARIERFRNQKVRDGHVSRRNANRLLAITHAIFVHACAYHSLNENPAAKVKKLREAYDAARYEFFTPDEIHQLVTAAASEQDGAVFLTAAFTGLRRGELVALRWQDVDFENSSIRVYEGFTREIGRPKSRRSRTVPMVDEVADALRTLQGRGHYVGPKDLVFPGQGGDYADPSALRRRYVTAVKRAGLPPLRFHDLRHTFGSLAINYASIVQVQAWMGHADIKTTMRYLHHKSRADEARVLSRRSAPAHQIHPHRLPPCRATMSSMPRENGKIRPMSPERLAELTHVSKLSREERREAARRATEGLRVKVRVTRDMYRPR
jgi:integrase